MTNTWKLCVLLPLFACNQDEKQAEPVTTTDAVGATGWGDNVAVTLKDSTFHYSSDGYPNHALNDQYVMPDDASPCIPHPTPDCTHIEPLSTSVLANPIDLEITTLPEMADSTASTPFGAMAVMISGVYTYNPYEGDGTTVAMSANFTLTATDGTEVPFMYSCNVHPSPHPQDAYHYHGLPMCVTSQVDEDGGPSHIIGFGFDGFPVYGDRDINGDEVDPAGLDECNGLESPTPEFPDGIYHYVLLELETEQSTVRCLHGKLAKPLEAYQYL